MKQLIFSTILLATLFTSACKKLNKIVQFNLDYKTQVTIPSTTGIDLPFNVLTPDIETNAQSSFEANDTRKDLINSIELSKLTLTVKSPQGEDFSFLKSAKVFIDADGLDEKEVAVIDPVPSNAGSVIELVPTGADLAPYIKADQFTLKVRTITDEALTRDHTIEVFSRFHVEGRLIGSD
ncbi:MAG: hypothetical protein H6608_06350 [Flavobacteriales bacterium]|nr:hypothetical protein [Bacteroidota bacterium]MCB9240730.1 hypothetical protein [Flavobacteriales bacterium]